MKIILRVFLLGVLGMVSLGAKTTPIAGENVTLDIPDDWTITAQEGILLAASDGTTSAIQVQRYDNSTNSSISSEFIREVKTGMQEKAPSLGATVKFTAERALTISGAPAYVVESDMTLPGKTVKASSFIIATHDEFFLISAQTIDPAKQTEVQAVATSFHFTVAPTLPEDDATKLAHQIGYFIGVGIAILAMVLIVGIIIRRARGR